MNKTIKCLANINVNTDEMARLLSTIESDTERIVDNTGRIASNTKNMEEYAAITAHHSAATSYYAKKNAELTNALGYLMALN